MGEFVQTARFSDQGLEKSYEAFETAAHMHNSGNVLYRAPLLAKSSPEQLQCAKTALEAFKTLKVMSPSPLFEPNGDIGGLWALGGFCITWQATQNATVLWACSEGTTIKASGIWDIQQELPEDFKRNLLKMRNRQKAYQNKVNKVAKATKKEQ